jgi:hypothetical protein
MVTSMIMQHKNQYIWMSSMGLRAQRQLWLMSIKWPTRYFSNIFQAQAWTAAFLT